MKMTYAGIFFLLVYFSYSSCGAQIIETFFHEIIPSHMNPFSPSRYRTPQSPCPLIFQYQQRFSTTTGFLSIAPPSEKLVPVKVELKLELPTRLSSNYVGKIELVDSNQEVYKKLQRGSMISYRVYFPLSSPLPYVIRIRVNGKDICIGDYERKPGSSHTTITLNHAYYPYSTQLSNGGNSPTGDVYGETPTVIQNPAINTPDGFNKPSQVDTNHGNNNFQNRPESNTGSFQRPHVETTTFTPPWNYIDLSTPATTTFKSRTNKPTQPPQVQPFTEPQINPFPISSFETQLGTCGKPLTGNFLIADGEPLSKRGEWPWMVAIFQNQAETGGLKFFCGGTLISKYYVLTAAHCMKSGDTVLPPEKFTLYLGKFNLIKWTESHTQSRDVKNIYMNPSYDSRADADLSIMELSASAEYGPYVQPACMWPLTKTDLSEVVGRIGTVVGWGLDENNRITTSVPKMAKMPIVSQEECLRSDESFVHLTSHRTFCAGFRNGTGPCNGDSGGGFLLPLPDMERGGMKWYLRGVVSTSLKSTGITFCDQKNYVIFTDVAKHSDWLSQFVGI